MRTVAVIQAHMGSSRLPGKVLMEIAGKTMLDRVISRTQLCQYIDEVVVATSTLPIDDAIVRACEKMDVHVSRGSDPDVLDRFTQAARAQSADVCVRITSDCPLIDPEVSDHIISRFLKADPPVDYASNKIPQSYPRGLDTEVFTISALESAHQQATERYQRAHVTVYIYQHPEQFRLLSIISDADRADWRWTVDTREDLEFVTQIYDRLGAAGKFGWRDVIAHLEREPMMHRINQEITQKSVQEE
jgi:spore coat polysaccharide biosynthesis protein SpsF